jgi:hypothetical protein
LRRGEVALAPCEAPSEVKGVDIMVGPSRSGSGRAWQRQWDLVAVLPLLHCEAYSEALAWAPGTSVPEGWARWYVAKECVDGGACSKCCLE